RALQDQEGRDRGVLVLDEPTTALPEAEVELLLDALRSYAEAGQSMLFVSHDLDAVLGIAGRITVLRDGRAIATVDTHGLDHDRLVELITGRAAAQLYPDAPVAERNRAMLEVRGLTGSVIRDVTFDANAGEILRLAGLVGPGPHEILQCIFGARAPTRRTRTEHGGRPYAPVDRALAAYPHRRRRGHL